MKKLKSKPKPYRPPMPDFRNMRRGKEEMARLIAESEQRDAQKASAEQGEEKA